MHLFVINVPGYIWFWHLPTPSSLVGTCLKGYIVMFRPGQITLDAMRRTAEERYLKTHQ